MKILLIGPHHPGGSLPPYLDVLADALRGHGAQVDRLGAPGLPYDVEQGRFWDADAIIAAADALLEQHDLTHYDLLSAHFGNLEIEQLLPARWSARRPPAVYHIHSLDWTLFDRHVPSPALRRVVAEGVTAMDGYVAFGSYGLDALQPVRNPHAPTQVSFLPTTIGRDRLPLQAHRSGTALTASLYGYPAPWKDIPGLLETFARCHRPWKFTLRGPFWDDPAQAGIQLPAESASRHGLVTLTVQPQYADASARALLAASTDLAVFPYRSQATFQGSGALADYLAHGTPVLATDVANMAELIGDAGIVVPPGNPAELAVAMDDFAADPDRRHTLTRAAGHRARLFQPDSHAADCLALYRAVLART